MFTDALTIRRATFADRAGLIELQQASLRTLGIHCYEPAAIEALIKYIGTMESSVLNDHTCYVAELDGKIVGCGAWTKRVPAYSVYEVRKAAPLKSAATVRSIYVHPDYGRHGIASRLMKVIEADIVQAGFTKAALEATLNGAAFYRRLGYRDDGSTVLQLPGGMQFGSVTMHKDLAKASELRTDLASAA